MVTLYNQWWEQITNADRTPIDRADWSKRCLHAVRVCPVNSNAIDLERSIEHRMTLIKHGSCQGSQSIPHQCTSPTSGQSLHWRTNCPLSVGVWCALTTGSRHRLRWPFAFIYIISLFITVVHECIYVRIYMYTYVYRERGRQTDRPHIVGCWLLEFDILGTYEVISKRVPTCDNAHS